MREKTYFAWIDVATIRLDIWVVREERRHRDTRSIGDPTT